MIQSLDTANPGSHRGFTAIELLVVLMVVAILAAIALPSFDSTIKRYRVSTAASEIVNALQLARANAVRLRSNVGVSIADGCTGANWNCGIDVWRDPENTGAQDTALAAPANPLKTIPATAFRGVSVQFASAGNAENIIYSPLGFVTGANGVIAKAGAIHVWPDTEGKDPQAASYANTVCLGAGGEVSVVAQWVDPAAASNPCN